MTAGRRRWKQADKVCEVLQAGKHAFVSGLYGSSRPFLVSLLAEKWRGPVLVVTSGPKEERDFMDDLRTFSPRPVFLFPARETLPGEGREHPGIVEDRFRVLDMLMGGAFDGILVSSVQALLEKLPSGDSLLSSAVDVEEGSALDLKATLSRLLDLGYEREAMVMERGQFSVRGGILDVFPSNEAAPVRVELDGERVASIRSFDAADQRSQARRESVRIMMCDELVPGGRASSLIEYLPGSSLICFDEPAVVKDAAMKLAQGGEELFDFYELMEKMRGFALASLSDIGEEIEEAGDAAVLKVDTRSGAILPAAEGLPGAKAEFWHNAFDRIESWVKDGHEVLVYCNNEGERARLLELIGEKGKLLSSIELGSVSSPFLIPEMKLAFLTDSEIFGRYKVRRPRRAVSRRHFRAAPSEIEPGDYVVHVEQGIGRYIGLRKLKRDGAEREYMAVEYRGGATLYVPVEQAHLVDRYVGLGRRRPSLDVLGSSRWTRRKARAQRAIIDFASDLLEMQALRSSLRGIKFSADGPWQREFEASFIYEETPDQEMAIAEVKADMERAVPMDRLICGDVGYGKTEVAIRAAFKAVLDGKQVAVLVPTTVLAQQHYNTFSDRLADYPVELRALSRFQSPGEQREAVEGLMSGRVDIVIGTHRLLQGDIRFKDLGLVVVDEEQRFGVTHKERLKRYRKLVDVLTMTATPIPRTLYLSTTGIRDMSVIDTPPQDRLSVMTEIIHHDEKTIRDAILRELAREGQVYYVHNRVATIGRVARNIEKLVPEARVGVAHGQMGENALAATMERFFAGGIDVLVCTTIIESGLDVPNVNTIFIEAAHRFGLADLYQLRGRVGRYKHRAFAYLIIPRGPIGDEGRRRLRAISEHSELGAGFSIAMRDLEIRGAGNVLGRQQHGHILAMGFDLYCRLLKAAIDGLSGRKVAMPYEVAVDIGVHPSIPKEYVSTGRLRIDIYRRLAGAGSDAEIDALGEEMLDRFGPLPDGADHCLELARMKLHARDAGVRSIELAGDRLLLDTPGGRVAEKVKSRSFRGIIRAAEKVLKGLTRDSIVHTPEA